MKISLKISLYILALVAIWGCTAQQERNLDLLPPAKGARGEIILVMDSVLWNGELGDAARKVFIEAVYGLPQAEPMFTTRHVSPTHFRGLLKRHKNVVIVTTFDSETSDSRLLQRGFTKASRETVMRDSSQYLMHKKDEYAKGQQVMHLFGKTEDQLIRKLKKNKKVIQDIINSSEEIDLRERLLSGTSLDKGLSKLVSEKHGLRMKIPGGYRIAKDTAGFVWMRYPELRFDKNIFIAYKPYTSEKQFELDSIVNWRDELCKTHLYGDKERNPNSFILTEPLMPAKDWSVLLNNEFAKEVRGLWKTKNLTMGGPFISYVFVDQETQRLYYVEGFVFAPSRSKREFVRELKVTITSMDKKM